MTHRAIPLVLDVDHDAAARRAAARHLRLDGFAVAEASNAASGMASAVELEPDLLLLDADLPDLSGLEVCRRLRSDPRTSAIPVAVVSSARSGVEPCAEGIDAGADAYLVRPVEPGQFLATVRTLVRRRPTEPERPRRERAIPRAREDALRAAAWELSGPASALRIAAKGLLDDLRPADSVARARATAILGAARAIDRVLADLVDLARADARSDRLSRASISAADVIAAAIELAPGARLECSAPAPDLRARCDPSRLRQILAPVLRRVAGRGAGASVRISVEGERGKILFSVERADAPAGVADRDRLFEPYWIRTRSRRRPGLELALAKALVEAHGGQMWAAASGGERGLSVSFTLPASEP